MAKSSGDCFSVRQLTSENKHLVNSVLFRLFDQNYDGYIDKKEFKWMTTSAKVSNKTIDIVFSVSFTFPKTF